MAMTKFESLENEKKYKRFIMGERSMNKQSFYEEAIKRGYEKGIENFNYYHYTFSKNENEIPSKVIFNKEKGKTTLLFSNSKQPPYEVYSSKVYGDDVFDKELGFLLTYFKYLNRDKKHKELKEIVKNVFSNMKSKAQIKAFFLGTCWQEGTKIVDVKTFEDIVNAIRHTDENGVWVYEEWEHWLSLMQKDYEKKQEIKQEIKNKEIELDNLRRKLSD